MTSGERNQAQRYIRSIQRSLAQLEGLVKEIQGHAPEPRPHDPRSELLEQIHLAGAMEQRQLFRLLDQRDMNHTWIGAQVGAHFAPRMKAEQMRVALAVLVLVVCIEIGLGLVRTPDEVFIVIAGRAP